MEFCKLHALGNDFLILCAGAEGTSGPLGPLSIALCDRRRGVGADGAIFYQPTIEDPDADYSALIFNADGSKAEISGNGIRCLAAMLARSGDPPAGLIRVRTVAGVRHLNLLGREGLSDIFRCTMGEPVLDPARIPARVSGQVGPLLDYPLPVGEETVGVSLCSMGNPHCSTFWTGLDEAPVERLGRALENHPVFPRRTNVEFIEVLNRHRIRVRFWERGVGVTPASGSGSCAAAVVAILRGSAESPIVVETQAGELEVEWERSGEVMLTGPATFICSGNFSEH